MYDEVLQIQSDITPHFIHDLESKHYKSEYITLILRAEESRSCSTRAPSGGGFEVCERCSVYLEHLLSLPTISPHNSATCNYDIHVYFQLEDLIHYNQCTVIKLII